MNLAQKRICVTGGGGFLGKSVVEELQRCGCSEIFVPRSADFDLRREEAIDRMWERACPQVLIHAAARVGGIGANRQNPGTFFYDNAIMGIQLIEAARRHRIEKLVILGTTCSYPKFATVPFREDRLWDGYPEETNAPYGIAKKALLVQAQAYRQQFGLNAIYLIPVNLYGPRDNFDLESSHVIPALIRKCVEANERGLTEMVCWGDGTPSREFLYVDDCAQGIVAAASRYEDGDPVNLGSGREIRMDELAALIAELTEFKGRLRWDASYPNGQPRRCLNTERAERSFGFRARTELREGLERTIAWYRAQQSVAKL
ncbi:MAG: GDP-L-fucose synthase [Acidobacteria bacterium]|nr:GDP-L-fucose synthase [Acidobacteriota bacterium]